MGVREARRGEWTAVADLTQAAYADLPPDRTEASWLRYEASTRETLLADNDAVRLVLEAEGVIVASVLLCPPHSGTAGIIANPHHEMRLLAVHPEHRNRRLGGRLIEACEARVRTGGHHVITLHTTALMDTARGMYMRRGYVRSPELDFEPAPGFIVWGYRKELAPS